MHLELVLVDEATNKHCIRMEQIAKKQLKGADPIEKLTWHTPEVSAVHALLLKCMPIQDFPGGGSLDPATFGNLALQNKRIGTVMGCMLLRT